jgi:hypothetical protein
LSTELILNFSKVPAESAFDFDLTSALASGKRILFGPFLEYSDDVS